MDELYVSLGTDSLLRIMVTLLCILLTWWALKIVRFDIFVKDIKSIQSRVLQLILAIVIGFQLGQFFIAYSDWSSGLRGLL